MAFFFEQSEEPSADERRLEYFSGWDGRGTGVALADGPAAVWVSAGDVRRARGVLSCAWHVLDADNPSQPGVAEWILVRIQLLELIKETLSSSKETNELGIDFIGIVH